MNALDLALALGLVLSEPNLMTPPITKEQEALVAKMGDENFYVREKATETLEKLDHKAFRAIRKALDDDDPEIRQRASLLMNRFYACLTSKNEVPGIHGLYKMASFTLVSGKTIEISDSTAIDYYSSVGGESDVYDQNTNSNNEFTRMATARFIKDLRNAGYTKQDVTEVLDKMAEETVGEKMGEAGYKKFREMQGLEEYDHSGP